MKKEARREETTRSVTLDRDDKAAFIQCYYTLLV
jgi:hypothetical protein